MRQPSRVDLHLHTTVSDGHLTPRELVRRAHANGVRTLAVTDHDNTDGLAEAQAEADALGLTLIPGIELSTDLGPIGVHVLGYPLQNVDTVFKAGLLLKR